MHLGSKTESLRNIELVKPCLTGRLKREHHKILGLELRKVKSIRALRFCAGHHG